MKLKLALALSATILASGCTLKYTTSQHFITTDKLNEPKKEGQACTAAIGGWPVAFGDITIEKARNSAAISEVISVEQKVTQFLGFGQFCTVVKGN
jgi:TRL-like protein family